MLRVPCPECGTPNVSGAMFCSECSEELPASQQAAITIPDFPGASSSTTGILSGRAKDVTPARAAEPIHAPASAPPPASPPAPSHAPHFPPAPQVAPASRPAATAKRGFMWEDEATGSLAANAGPARSALPPAAAAPPAAARPHAPPAPPTAAAPPATARPPTPAAPAPARPPASAAQPGSNLWFERYADPVEVGRGGAGTVYRARDVRTGQVVALKRMLEESGFHASRIRREVDARRQLTHPGVVRVFDLIADSPADVCLVMEFVGGGDLQRRIETDGALSVEATVALGRKLAEILAHAHQNGVIHRDLKPANVLLDERGDPHVTDFGLARGPGITSLTSEGQVLGTYDFLAPEQRRDLAQADVRSDIYALGKTLFCAVTGLPPYTVRESRIPEAVRSVILRCLEDEPKDRYPSMAALAEDLARVSSPRPPAFELVALNAKDEPLARFRLADGDNVIGVRAEGNDPAVDLTAIDKHQIVSRRHARVSLKATDLTITHMSTTNPTHLNGRLIAADASAPLVAGDRIVLSTNVVLEVRRT